MRRAAAVAGPGAGPTSVHSRSSRLLAKATSTPATTGALSTRARMIAATANVPITAQQS
jgi:hypothetical protein